MTSYESALKKAREHVMYYLHISPQLQQGLFPDACCNTTHYTKHENKTCWTEGFYTGILALCYEAEADENLYLLCMRHLDSFKQRLDKKWVLDHHDIGFLYSLSCVAIFKVFGDSKAKKVAIEAAYHLLKRYSPLGGFIQAWGPMYVSGSYRLIIDCYMNLPLLFFAYEQTGDSTFYDAASQHAYTALHLVMRGDGSTYHTYYFDVQNHQPLYGETAQGYGADSTWSRGQAWAIYGFILAYRYTKDSVFLEAFYKVTDYFIDHLPKDQVPYWDLIFKDTDGEPKDTSSAAIAICGILEWDGLVVDQGEKPHYLLKAHEMLIALNERHTPSHLDETEGLLKNGVYSIPHGQGVDTCNLWGDYFYLEALVRLTQKWKSYW